MKRAPENGSPTLVKRAWFWLLLFFLVFLLTQDYLFTKWSDQLYALGFPDWLWWFIGVHLIFVICFYLFTRLYWKEEK